MIFSIKISSRLQGAGAEARAFLISSRGPEENLISAPRLRLRNTCSFVHLRSIPGLTFFEILNIFREEVKQGINASKSLNKSDVL
jgi:hypothetical protein